VCVCVCVCLRVRLCARAFTRARAMPVALSTAAVKSTLAMKHPLAAARLYETATKKPRVYVLVHAATPRFTTTIDAEPAAATVFATCT